MLDRLSAAFVDRAIRRKVAVHEVPLNRFRIRVARSVREHQEAFRLLHVAYVYQGIKDVRSDKLHITPQHVLPEATVFVAYEGDRCVGTMTVTLDSPAGLAIREDFPSELDALRATGAKLVEYGSLAVLQPYWKTGVALLLNMAATYWSATMLHASDIVVAVNPKAMSHYRAVYGLRVFGTPRKHATLTAPMVAMGNTIPKTVEHFRKYFSKPLSSGLTFAEHALHYPPECIEIPVNLSQSDLVRWKLSRSVFQQLFIEKSDRLDALDAATLSYLQRYRSAQTLDISSSPFLHRRFERQRVGGI